jgi:hypothetical protein
VLDKNNQPIKFKMSKKSLLKTKELRKKYPKFIYQGYSYKISKNNLEVFFDFEIPSGIYFKPKIVIKNVKEKQLGKIRKNALNNFLFHIGLMEIPSYWKATCSPKIEIKAGYLNKEQIKWWKDLIIKGMGQFFYENKIDFRGQNFLKIVSNSNNKIWQDRVLPKLNLNKAGFPQNKILIPIGGGKDSIVTLEILKKAKKEINCFYLNPTSAAVKIIKTSGCKNPVIVERKIDKKLLELNQKGFLNGHTPFSAYLSFLGIFCAEVFGYKYIAFSQEQSSNEGNAKYLGKIINHQWSKSFEFEKKFRQYSKKYLTENVECFSFLRPLYEIQIAKIFSDFSDYFPIFLSCNEAYKTYSGTKKITKKWCGNCSKCLFVFSVLYPFIEEKKLVKIFNGENLFEKKELLLIMKELIGERKIKPLECVGTKKECVVAFYFALHSFKRRRVNTKLPFLLNYFEKKILPKYPNLKSDVKKIMKSWNKQNNLPKNFEKVLKKYSKE